MGKDPGEDRGLPVKPYGARSGADRAKDKTMRRLAQPAAVTGILGCGC